MATSKKSSKKLKKSNKAANYQSFRVYKDKHPFMSFLLTEQTIYWSFLLVLILILALWVLNNQLNIIRIVDNISLAG